MSTLYSFKSDSIRKTWLLMSVFLVLFIVLGFIFSQVFKNPIILYVFVAFSILINFLSYYYSDKMALALARAKPIEKKDNPELYRLVENLCIASGLPLPKIYLTPDLQPNAFATGRDKNHASIAFTQGILQRLNKTELEGVTAHELSHVKNRDILVSTIAVMLAGIISIVADTFLRMTFWGFGARRDDREGNSALIFIIAIVAAILAPLAAMLIQLAISRKRESLADISGALLTRYPEGLANALEKISSDPHPMQNPSTAINHLYIADPSRGKQKTSWFTKLFMTHPPIEERIKALRALKI